MASTSTASLNQSVTGYIHNVTPLRHGVKRQYFEGVLQQRHKVCKVVVFKVELHSKFLKIEKDRCPVQLNNVVVQPSRREDGMDILFTHQSKWCCLTSIDYPYNPTIMVTIQDQTISQILQIDMEYHRVSIRGGEGEENNFSINSKPFKMLVAWLTNAGLLCSLHLCTFHRSRN